MAIQTYGRSGGTDARRRLAAIREQISEARDERAQKRKARDDAREAFSKADFNGPVTQSREFERAQEAVRQLGAAEDRLRALEEEERDILSDMGMSTSTADDGSFLSDSGVRQALNEMSATTMPVGRVNLGFSSSRDAVVERFGMFAAAAGTFAAVGETDLPSDTARRGPSPVGPIVSLPRRPLRLLDLIPSAPLDSGSFDYLQEMPSANAAAEMVEGAVKPTASFVFEDAEARARTIPHYTKVKRQTLADVPALESVIRNRLERGVYERLEAQIVAGDGTGENLLGLLHTTGVAAPDVSGLENTMDAVLEGIVDVLATGAIPNASLVNPRDWADALRAKASGDGQYLSVGPFADAVERMWSAPTIPTPAVPEGTAIVGDFAAGMTVLVREGVQVLVSDSDQDDFIRNRITLLGEGRFAVPIWQPAAFAVVDLTTVGAAP